MVNRNKQGFNQNYRNKEIYYRKKSSYEEINNVDKNLYFNKLEIIKIGEKIYKENNFDSYNKVYDEFYFCFNETAREPKIELPKNLNYNDGFLLYNNVKDNPQYDSIKNYCNENILNKVNKELSTDFNLKEEEIPDWYEDDDLNEEEFNQVINFTNQEDLFKNKKEENNKNMSKEEENLYYKEMQKNINKLLNRDNDDDSLSKSEELSDYSENEENENENNKFNEIMDILDKNNVKVEKEEIKKKEINNDDEIDIEMKKYLEGGNNDNLINQQNIIPVNNNFKNKLNNEQLEKLKAEKKQQFIQKYSYMDHIICSMVYDTLNSKNLPNINPHSVVGINSESVSKFVSNSYKIFSFYMQGKIFNKVWYYKDKLSITQGPLMSFDMDIYNKENVFDKDTMISPDNINYLPYQLYQDREMIALNTIENFFNKLELNQNKKKYLKDSVKKQYNNNNNNNNNKQDFKKIKENNNRESKNIIPGFNQNSYKKNKNYNNKRKKSDYNSNNKKNSFKEKEIINKKVENEKNSKSKNNNELTNNLKSMLGINLNSN